MADQPKDRAATEFKKVQRTDDGRNALAISEAQANAMREKTARLRALRLARDAELPPPAPKQVPAAKKKGATARKKSSENLATWLDDQQKGGRNS